MSDFTTTTLDPKILDPFKRVRYTMGLVLGQDEFNQEQVYLMERDRLHNRALHGYGTVHGLQVSSRSGSDGAEVVVSPGMAVDPLGRSICVSTLQCARLNAWLSNHDDAVRDAFGSLPEAISVYVMLCYQECETDLVPVPGGPCRSQEDSRTASRIADDFELRLVLEPPPEVEETVIRRFGALLRRIQITDTCSPDCVTEDDLLALVRTLADETGSPPDGSFPDDSPPDGSPPDSDAPLLLHPDAADAILRAVFRVWVTEVRPLLPGGPGCSAPEDNDDACVLLARLDIDVTEDGSGNLEVDQSGGGETPGLGIDQDDRPYLLSTRVLQQWLAAVPALFPDVPEVLNDLDDVNASPAVAGEVLGWNGTDTWVAIDHGGLAGLGDDDHAQYFNQARGDVRYAQLAHTHALGDLSDLDAGGNPITNLGAATVNGEAVRFEQAIKINDNAGGDLGDTYPNPTVQALQTRPLADIAPDTAQALAWTGTAWAPQDFIQAVGSPYQLVAAGFFTVRGRGAAVTANGPVYNQLRALVLTRATGTYRLLFRGYVNPLSNEGAGTMYIVKGTVQGQTSLRQALRATFEFLEFRDDDILVRVLGIDGERIQPGMGFMVEISGYGRTGTPIPPIPPLLDR